MKSNLITLALITVCALSYSQAPAPVADSLFVVVYTTGPSWDASKPPPEQPYFKEHSANLGKLRKDGVIKLGARYADKGMIILSAASSAAARELIYNDPGVVNKLFNADLQKFNVFYFGCLEKPR